ncbi:DGQHR domain-containing protein [Curtobacterium flaccumfaciens]|uniref:DGQHR domain-containing protein n=1 Tax=Curtobacterium flaccumfaciens TaxID=2035 RepID=UPI0021C77C06|nr:DGQHR domain-containing protein [Curtobacterium flaccumfaciens]UXN21994.1 DGQHR domain-containing protein [Curtobacterium flaccumfaciens pv. flaccumfaciens]
MANKKLKYDELKSVPQVLRSELEQDGWVLDRQLKRSSRMRRPKSHDVRFEDRVWAMLAKVGFSSLNKKRSFTIAYGPNENQKKQIDVFALDGDVALVVECKSSGAERAPSSAFKADVEAIQGYREGVIRAIRNEFPDIKVKFVLATNNFRVSDETKSRIEDAGVFYLDDEAVEYYLELAAHLGSAAKYQLLGNVFQGTKIQQIASTVPAIRGRMGGTEYFTFMIEPHRLLKLAYVLHRSKANDQWMPTYQRIIKKGRLKKVREFVEDGGFFPNSLVLSIDGDGRKLRFDKAGGGDLSAVGVLHLPQTYHSIYVIDGQHRLYGYTESERGSTELIPVVAFVNLERKKQVELFMQINENQQAVPANLRSTLNSDLLWESENPKLRARALRLRVAQHLGEHRASPLRGRVIIGEDKQTHHRCISLEAIGRGIDKSGLVGSFNASGLVDPGVFYRGENDATFRAIVPVLERCFDVFIRELPDQWNIGKGDGGFVFINPSVEALIRVAGDVAMHLSKTGRIDGRSDTADQLFTEMEPYLKAVTNYVSSLTLDEGTALKKSYGSAAVIKYWRRYQEAIWKKHSDFEPVGLKEFLEGEVRQFNTDTFVLIGEVESFLKRELRRRLQDRYGATWYRVGVPQKVYQGAKTLAAEKEWAKADTASEVDWWDCLHLSDYHQILAYKQDIWNEVFGDDFTPPSDRNPRTSWKAKSGWMNELIRIRNQNAHEYSVTEKEYETISALHAWLGVSGTGD